MANNLRKKTLARLCATCPTQIADRSFVRYCYECGSAVFRQRQVAAAAIAKAIKSGALPKARTLTCVDCGKPALDYEHRDYRRPLDVQPVCRPCNYRRGPALFSRAQQEA